MNLQEQTNRIKILMGLHEESLVAPNGKPSNLSPELYRLVRTPEFKNWFGDWENNPEGASKVVDENGEPMVMYHGTNQKFKEFKPMLGKRNTFVGLKNVKSSGFFFTKDVDYANKVASAKVDDTGGKKNIFNVFLNIRNMLDLSSFTYESEELFKKLTDSYPHEYFGYDENLDQWWRIFDDEEDINIKINKLGYDGVKLAETTNDNRNADIVSYVVFNSSQIKSASGFNTKFNSDDPDIENE